MRNKPNHKNHWNKSNIFGYKTKSTKANWEKTKILSSNSFAFDDFIQWIHSTTTTTASAETTTENAAESEQNEVKTVSKQLAATQQTNNWQQKPNDSRTGEKKESKHKINNKT